MKVNDIKSFERRNKIELPKDENIEKSMIGTLLIHPEFILKFEYIKPKFFYNRDLGCIYHVINSLYNESIVEIDNFLIANEIEGNKNFKEVFENSGIKNIDKHIEELRLLGRSTIEEYEYMCKKVITMAFKRESFIKLNEISKDILSTDEDINNINYNLQQSVANFSKIYISNDEIKSLGEQADSIWEGIISKRNSGFFGLPSKFEELNKYLTYEKTELVLISAPKKTGKSNILSNEAWHKAINGVPTLYIDREMSTENHMLRMLAFLSGIENRRLKSGELSVKEEMLVREKLKLIKTLPFYHTYEPLANLNELYMKTKSLQLKHGVEFLVYDYVKANQGGDSDKEYQVLGRQTDWLKNEIAGSLNLACLGSAQMDDSGKKVADSQKIERNCSSSIHVVRKTMEEIAIDGKDSGNLKMMVKFNRNGAMTEEDEYINLYLNGNIATVSQAKNPFTCTGDGAY